MRPTVSFQEACWGWAQYLEGGPTPSVVWPVADSSSGKVRVPAGRAGASHPVRSLERDTENRQMIPTPLSGPSCRTAPPPILPFPVRSSSCTVECSAAVLCSALPLPSECAHCCPHLLGKRSIQKVLICSHAETPSKRGACNSSLIGTWGPFPVT